MGFVVQNFTDYSTPCGQMPETFLEMLAACIVGYELEDGTTHYFVNVISAWDYCDDLTDFWICAIGGITPESAERALVENTFALDECGRLAWKLFLNYGGGRQ